jgi:hypothetical protein
MSRGKRWPLLLGFALVTLLVWRMWPWDQQIDPSDVVRVEVEPKGAQHVHPLGAEEARQVIGWFNQAGEIVDNSHHGAPGCGAHSALNFYLKSGDVVTVDSYMRVTRGEPRSGLEDLDDFYFKQPDLERYLRDWDAKADAGGC